MVRAGSETIRLRLKQSTDIITHLRFVLNGGSIVELLNC